MHAQVGDWLVVEAPRIDQMPRRAEILAVPSADGQPPYTVRWLDSEHIGVVFPGPDAHIVTSAQQLANDQARNARSTTAVHPEESPSGSADTP